MDPERWQELLQRARANQSDRDALAAELDEELAGLLAGLQPGSEDPVLAGLLGPELAELVRRAGWNSLVLNPGSTSTKVSVYCGLVLMAEADLQPAGPGGSDLDARVARVLDWLAEQGFEPSELTGIAARGGLMAPVEAGTFRISERMLADLAASPVAHPSNLAAPMARAIGRQVGPDVVLTTTDPVMIDEVDPVHRLTGSARVVDDGTAVHYLNHRAVATLVARLLGRPRAELHLVTCHMGGGMSAARHLGGRVVQVAQAFGTLPSANRSGALPLYQVIRLMEDHAYGLEELKADVTRAGGLLALAGTEDFRELFALARHGSEAQQAKVRLLLRFFATRVAGWILKLSAAERPLDAVVLTGGLAHDQAFCRQVAGRLHLAAPVVRLPGALEQSALAAGLLRACADHESLQDYSESVERVAAGRDAAARLASVVLIAPPARAEGARRPLGGLEDVIEAACTDEPPTVALVGADNHEALLAVKQAAEHESARACPMARFLLLGRYAPVTQLAWELDLAIDDDWVTVVDTHDPVASAQELLAAGLADTVMKGSLATAAVLKGYLHHLKATSGDRPLRRLSHLALFDIPGRPRLVALTDAAMNTYPDVEARLEILDNALGALKLLGLERPKVAVLSATEKPSAAVGSSVEARQIAERLAGRDDLIVEGPLALDLAMSAESAREKRYRGRIQGDADLLLVPDIDAGNAVYKAFTVASGADTAGVVLGGQAPLILTSRGDSARSKLASIALAVLLIRRARAGGAQ